jgi:hypothetical protein
MKLDLHLRILCALGAAVATAGTACSSDDAAAGCSSDAECKGDRICELGECRTPRTSGSETTIRPTRLGGGGTLSGSTSFTSDHCLDGMTTLCVCFELEGLEPCTEAEIASLIDCCNAGPEGCPEAYNLSCIGSEGPLSDAYQCTDLSLCLGAVSDEPNGEVEGDGGAGGATSDGTGGSWSADGGSSATGGATSGGTGGSWSADGGSSATGGAASGGSGGSWSTGGGEGEWADGEGEWADGD